MNDDKKTDINKLQMWLCQIIGKLKRNASTIIVIVGIFIIFIFLAVLFSNNISCFIEKWLDMNGRKEILEFLGWGIGGIIASYGLVSLNKRADAQAKSAAAQDKSAAAQVETNKLTEKGHVQDRFKAAVEHLSNQYPSARIASFYEFFYLAKDENIYIPSILDILCAHLRHISSSINSEEKPSEEKPSEEKAPEEIKTLIGILFSPDAVDIFGELDYDLQRTNLNGVNFQKMQKPKGKVDFSFAELVKANFNETDLDLSGFNFQGANLKEANLFKANLEKAELRNANLEKANLQGAILKGAHLEKATLDEAELRNANLEKAELHDANLKRARLFKANLEEARLWDANLEKANFLMANLKKADFWDANLSGASAYEANLQGANFRGANLQGANFHKADLRGTDLHEAKFMEDVKLSEAKYNDETKFPEGFVPENKSMRYCPPDNDKE